MLKRLSDRYIDFCARRAGWPLLVGLMLAAAGLALSPRIRIDARIEALLPGETPAQAALDELRARVPSSSPLYLLVQSPDAVLNRRLSRQIAARVAKWPETRAVVNRRDPAFFLDRRLLFLPAEDLREIADDIEARVDWEHCEAQPGCMNIDDRPDTPDEASLQARFRAVPEVQTLLTLFGMDELPTAAPDGDQKPSAAPADPADPADPDAPLPGELCSSDGQVCAVQAVIDGSASDVAFAQQIAARAEALFAELRPAHAQDLVMSTSGDYRNAPMLQQSVRRDLRNTTLLSVGLIVAVLLIQFRGGRAFLLLLGPLLLGIVWALGAIALFHPTLNLISAFTLAVLAGIGIDFGVHLITHYGRARAEHDPVVALKHTYADLGPSMLVAGVTTACGFAALTAARFRGFAEMGLLASVGVGLTLLAFLTVLPALVLFAHRVVPERRPVLRPLKVTPVLWPIGRGPAVVCFTVGLVVATALGLVGRDLEFQYDFRKLRPEVVQHGIPWHRAMHGTTRNAVVMLADDPAALEAAAAGLRAEGLGEGEDGLQTWIVSPASFVPPDQPARLQAIGDLRRAVARADKHADEATRRKLSAYGPLLAVDAPIEAAQLPPWVRDWLTERDGSFGRFGIIYTGMRGSDARAMERLAARIDGWRKRFPDLHFASAAALLGTVVPDLRADAPVVVSLALLGLSVGVLLVSRSLSVTLLLLCPLAVSMAVSLGAMTLAGLRVDMYNMLVFPLAFGIGIDGAVYIRAAVREHGDEEVATSGRAVFGSTVTTVVAFGSLMVASNPGLASLGKVAVVTLTATLLVNLLWLPALLKLLTKGPSDAASPD